MTVAGKNIIKLIDNLKIVSSPIKTFALLITFLCLIACRGTIFPVSNYGSKQRKRAKKTVVYTGYSVDSILNGSQIIASDVKTFNLFPNHGGNTDNQSHSSLNFRGWNHTVNNSVTEWTNLKLAGSNYNFIYNSKIDSSYNTLPTLDIVLVKKIADWNHQHANGFECNLLTSGYKFGDIENLVFELKINSAKTNIATVESLKKRYAGYVNESAIDAIEDGKVNIGITLSDSTNLNGTFIFQLDQTILIDKWVRVTIPMNKLSFYQEINYNHLPKKLTDLSNVVINRMLIVGETKNSAVLRMNINSWNDTIPETFKEMNISFKKIELQLK